MHALKIVDLSFVDEAFEFSNLPKGGEFVTQNYSFTSYSSKSRPLTVQEKAQLATVLNNVNNLLNELPANVSVFPTPTGVLPAGILPPSLLA